MPKMFWLADYNYTTNHRFMVNGKVSVMTVCVAHCSDVDPTTKLSTAEWRRILVGGLNGGGRGYYALDVTDPTAPRTLWEFTSLDDADLGYSFGNPLAVKKSDGTWVILVTSGYNNVSQSNGDPYDAAGTGLGYLYVLNPRLERSSARFPREQAVPVRPVAWGEFRPGRIIQPVMPPSSMCTVAICWVTCGASTSMRRPLCGWQPLPMPVTMFSP